MLCTYSVMSTVYFHARLYMHVLCIQCYGYNAMHGYICIPCAYSVMAAANQSYLYIYIHVYAWSVHIVLWLRHAQFYLQDVFLTAAMQLYVYMHDVCKCTMLWLPICISVCYDCSQRQHMYARHAGVLRKEKMQKLHECCWQYDPIFKRALQMRDVVFNWVCFTMLGWTKILRIIWSFSDF